MSFDPRIRTGQGYGIKTVICAKVPACAKPHFRQLPLPSESSVECLPYSYLGLQVFLGLSYVPMYPRHTVCPPTPTVAHKNESYSVMHVPSPPLSITCLRTITRIVSFVRHWSDWSCWRVVGGEICHPLLSARARPSTVDSPGRSSHPQHTGPAPRTRSANAHAPATHRATLRIILAPVAFFLFPRSRLDSRHQDFSAPRTCRSSMQSTSCSSAPP